MEGNNENPKRRIPISLKDASEQIRSIRDLVRKEDIKKEVGKKSPLTGAIGEKAEERRKEVSPLDKVKKDLERYLKTGDGEIIRELEDYIKTLVEEKNFVIARSCYFLMFEMLKEEAYYEKAEQLETRSIHSHR